MNKSGIVFNIQKFSVNDGPGIRTVVFLKGCPLHCQWCANPESQLVIPQIFHDEKKCSHCHHCQSVCLQEAIRFEKDQIKINPSLCKQCLRCIHECPNSALEMQGKEKNIEEILKVVLQDEVFYEESGGGLTLSGGEVLLQADFAAELLKEAKKKHLHTCIETTGFSSFEDFKKVIEYVDYIFFDCKHWNDQKHQEATGLSHKKILKNLAYAASLDKELMVRIPVIPGFNADLSDALEFSKLFNDLHVQQCQLLPFHQFGENKYELLKKEYAYKNINALHREDLEDYRKIFIDQGIQASF